MLVLAQEVELDGRAYSVHQRFHTGVLHTVYVCVYMQFEFKLIPDAAIHSNTGAKLTHQRMAHTSANV